MIMKKILSIIAAIALALTMGTVASFAEGGIAFPDRNNLAFEQFVETYSEDDSCGNVVNPGWFQVENLVDGLLDVFDLDPTNLDQSLAWYTMSETRVADMSAVVDLDGTYKIGEVYLYPTKFLDGTPTPETFDVELSKDGENWTRIGGETKLRANAVHKDPFIYNGDGMEASFVRIHFTRMSAITDGHYYAGFGELEVYEYVEPQLNVRDFSADKDKQYFDQILINGEEKANGNDAVAALKANIDGSDGSINTISMFGWYGLVDAATPIADNLVSFGYMIDDGSPVFSKDFAIESEQTVLDGNGARYKITVDVSGLTDGENHVIKACARLANNDLVIFNRPEREAVINYKAPLVATPEPTEAPTEPATDAPTDAPAGDPTEAPATEPTEAPKKDNGCGGIAFSGLAVLALSAAAVLSLKRRKENG